VLYFFITLWELLKVVRLVFPECEETPRLMKMLENDIHPDPALLRVGISQYYDAMKEYFGHVERRDRSFLADASHLPFFYQLRMQEKLSDPELDDEDVNGILERIERLNALSEIYRIIPPAVFHEIYESAYEHIAAGATTAPTFDQAQTMGLNLLERIPLEEMNDLFSDTEKMKIVVKDFEKLKNLPGLDQFANVAKQILLLLDGPTDLI
jgi:hypothetical protein